MYSSAMVTVSMPAKTRRSGDIEGFVGSECAVVHLGVKEPADHVVTRVGDCARR